MRSYVSSRRISHPDDEYRIRKVTGDRRYPQELSKKLDGVNAGFCRLFVSSMQLCLQMIPYKSFDEGRPCAERADIPKSNWSYKGPFLAFNVIPGITFGLVVCASPQELRSSTQRETRSLAYLPRTNSSEEFFRWLSDGDGTGLVSGGVFGRIAGREAALS
jgi:hypothetical protein